MADDRKSNQGGKKGAAANKVAARKVAVKAAVSRRVVSKATRGISKAATGKANARIS